MNTKNTQRSARGQFIAETPMVLWVLFILIAFPMICIASMGLNAIFLYYACRDGAYQCAKEAKFSDGFNLANSKVASDLSTHPGVQLLRNDTHIIEKRLSDGVVTGTWSSSNPGAMTQPTVVNSDSIYFIQEHVKGKISPIVPCIPPYDLDVDYKVFVENPNGLID
jgi:hypothetical protein